MIHDLTLTLDEHTPVFPGNARQEIAQAATIANDGWNEKRLTFSTHFGTHIDAPAHMIEGGKTLTDYPIGKFVGDAIVLNFNEGDPDLSDVRENDIVFLRTGHIAKLHEPDYFTSNPVVSEQLARRLVEKRISIIGLDSFTPDNEPYTVHKILLEQDILIVENLTDLDPLVGRRCTCHILPLKLKDADGAPCRVIATPL